MSGLRRTGTSTAAATHVRRNIATYLVAFLALTVVPAFAAPADPVKKNSVSSKSIKDGAVALQDLDTDSVDSSKVAANSLTGADVNEGSLELAGILAAYQLRVTGTCPAGQAIRSIAVEGTVGCEPVGSTGGGGSPPIGPAAGDLSGTYPAPLIAPGAVTSTKLADGAVTSAKLADNAVGSAKISDGAVGAADTDPAQVQSRVSGACPAGQAIREIAAGGTVVCEVDDAGGSSGPPSGPAAGDLSGTYPDPAIGAGTVTSGKVADGSLTGADIEDDSLTANDIDDTGLLVWENLTGVPAGFADGTDDTGGTATDVDCDWGCVHGIDIANGSINGLDIELNSLGAEETPFSAFDHIKNGSIDSFDIADRTIGDLDIALDAIGGGHIADRTIGDLDIALDAIGGGHIADRTIVGADIAGNSLGAVEIDESTLQLTTTCPGGTVMVGQRCAAYYGDQAWNSALDTCAFASPALRVPSLAEAKQMAAAGHVGLGGFWTDERWEEGGHRYAYVVFESGGHSVRDPAISFPVVCVTDPRTG